jgi:Tfp pilus assembly protein FimT
MKAGKVKWLNLIHALSLDRLKDGFKNGRNRGYSLLETLLVLTLLAGMGFVLLVKLPVQLENRNLALASTQLVQELRNARQSAMSENTWYEVKFYPSESTYKIFREATLVKNIVLPEKIRINNRPSNVRFSATGAPTFSGTSQLTGTIALSNGQKSRNVITALMTGRVREEIK